jgi:hypothetical protein
VAQNLRIVSSSVWMCVTVQLGSTSEKPLVATHSYSCFALDIPLVTRTEGDCCMSGNSLGPLPQPAWLAEGFGGVASVSLFLDVGEYG